MTPARISLLMPTRGRVELARRFFDSVARCTARRDLVEIVLYVDEDDHDSHGLASTELSVSTIVGPRASMGVYNTACLQRSTGDIIMLANDDMVMLTEGWDERVRAVHAATQDRIYLAYGNDMLKGRKLCTFPILSRETCELLGEPFPRAYRGAFIDYHLFDVFKRLKHAGMDRIRYMPDVLFEHRHYRTGKAVIDATYLQRGRFDDDAVFFELADMRAQAMRTLAAAIAGAAAPALPGSRAAAPRPPSNVLLAGLFYTRHLLLNGALPLGWRTFLWAWFLARHVVSAASAKRAASSPAAPS
jgi:hypothetical protein